MRGRVSFRVDHIPAPVPEEVVTLARQSSRLCQHVAHEEHGIGPRPAIPPVPMEPGGCLHSLVIEMILNEKERFCQPTTLFGITAGPICLRQLMGKRA